MSPQREAGSRILLVAEPGLGVGGRTAVHDVGALKRAVGNEARIIEPVCDRGCLAGESRLLVREDSEPGEEPALIGIRPAEAGARRREVARDHLAGARIIEAIESRAAIE